jgi:hypothetical protein
MGDIIKRDGQHTLARQKNMKKYHQRAIGGGFNFVVNA